MLLFQTLRDTFWKATAVTNNGMDRAGLAPDPNLIVSQTARSWHRGRSPACTSLRVLALEVLRPAPAEERHYPLLLMGFPKLHRQIVPHKTPGFPQRLA